MVEHRDQSAWDQWTGEREHIRLSGDGKYCCTCYHRRHREAGISQCTQTRDTCRSVVDLYQMHSTMYSSACSHNASACTRLQHIVVMSTLMWKNNTQDWCFSRKLNLCNNYEITALKINVLGCWHQPGTTSWSLQVTKVDHTFNHYLSFEVYHPAQHKATRPSAPATK